MVNGILFALYAEKHVLHLIKTKALNQLNNIVMGPVNYEELTDYFSCRTDRHGKLGCVFGLQSLLNFFQRRSHIL
jgi:hypothetical protein